MGPTKRNSASLAFARLDARPKTYPLWDTNPALRSQTWLAQNHWRLTTWRKPVDRLVRSGPGRLALHHYAQNAVNARLIAPAMTLEPSEHVRIEANRQLLFHRRPSHRCLLEKCLIQWRNVRIVDIGILHAVNSRQVARFLANDRFFVHLGSPSSWE